MLLTGGKIVVAVLLIAGAFFLPASFVDNNENSDFALQWSKKKSNIADLNIDDKAFKTIVKLTTVKSFSLQQGRNGVSAQMCFLNNRSHAVSSSKFLNPICTGGAHNERTPINFYPSFLNK
jgi:hypothetical protein